MKQNFVMCIFTHRGDDFNVFVKCARNVLDHHFGDHSKCRDTWCPYNQLKDQLEKQKSLFYRDKIKDKKLYNNMLEIHKDFTSEEVLKTIHHSYSTNRCESINKVITKFVRKDTYICSTIISKARVHVAVSIESIRYEKYFIRLFKMMGMHLPALLVKHYRTLDKSRQYQYKYHRAEKFLKKGQKRKPKRYRKKFGKRNSMPQKGENTKQTLQDQSHTTVTTLLTTKQMRRKEKDNKKLVRNKTTIIKKAKT